MSSGVRAKKTPGKRERVSAQPSSGNVFADLGLPDAETELAKAKIAFRIHQLIEERGLTQTRAAEILGVDQPKVSALTRGNITGFSMDRLFRFLNALGQEVEIVIRPVSPRDRQAATRVAIP